MILLLCYWLVIGIIEGHWLVFIIDDELLCYWLMVSIMTVLFWYIDDDGNCIVDEAYCCCWRPQSDVVVTARRYLCGIYCWRPVFICCAVTWLMWWYVVISSVVNHSYSDGYYGIVVWAIIIMAFYSDRINGGWSVNNRWMSITVIDVHYIVIVDVLLMALQYCDPLLLIDRGNGIAWPIIVIIVLVPLLTLCWWRWWHCIIVGIPLIHCYYWRNDERRLLLLLRKLSVLLLLLVCWLVYSDCGGKWLCVKYWWYWHW